METENLKSGKKAEVLIIDDEVDICQLIVLILRGCNVKSSFVNSLSEAKLLLTKVRPPLIFLDNHLPDGTGLEFITYIKSVSPNSKVVMITAHSTEENKKIAKNNGAIHFIGKPFNSDEITETVKRFL